MRVVYLQTTYRVIPGSRPPGRGPLARFLAAAFWIFVFLTIVGMVGNWLESRKAKPPAAPAGPDVPSREAREAEEVFDELGLDESVVKRLLPTLESPAAAATLKKRFELDAETESRFLSLLKAMEERRGLLKKTVLVHQSAVGCAKDLQDLILRHVREGGPLGRPGLRELWRAAVEAKSAVEVPEVRRSDEIHQRVATHQLVQRSDVARRAVTYRLCGEAVRTLVAAHEPIRRLLAALPAEVRGQAFPTAPRPGADRYFDQQLAYEDPQLIQLAQFRWFCGGGLFWLFEYNDLDIREVERDFDLAADDLECLLLLREPLGRIAHEYQPARYPPQRPGAGRSSRAGASFRDFGPPPSPIDPDEVPAWIQSRSPARPRP